MEARSFPLVPWLAVYAIAAAVLATSKFFALHTADSIIYTLASLQHWSLFFWEQDRVGLLIPLLTSPVRNPFINLVIQTWLTCFLGLALPAVLVRLLLPKALGATAAMLANVWFILAAPEALLENHCLFTMYPLGLVLALSALIVLEPFEADFLPLWRWVLATVLMMLAMWSYIAVIVLVVPLAFVQRLQVQNWQLKALWRRDRCFNWHQVLANFAGVIVATVGFAVGYALMRWGHDLPDYYAPTSNEAMPIAEWPRGLIAFRNSIHREPGGAFWLNTTFIATATAAIITRKSNDRAVLRTAGLLLFVAIVEVLFCTSRKWIIDINHANTRYIIATLTAVPLAAAVMLLSPFSNWLARRSSWLLMLAGLLVLVASIVIRFGVPSLSRARSIIDERFGQHSADILSSGAPAISGQYWTMWTTYYHVLLLKYDRNDTSMIVPVGWRTMPFREAWNRLPSPFMVAVPRGYFRETDLECIRRGLEPLTKIGEHGTIDLYVTRLQPK